MLPRRLQPLWLPFCLALSLATPAFSAPVATPAPAPAVKLKTPARPESEAKAKDRASQMAQGALLAALSQPQVQAIQPAIEAESESGQYLMVAARAPKRQSTRVLMIGDSLTVGGFGDEMLTFLEGRFDSVFLFAQCGSSPEHWLQEEPKFYSRCGYKEKLPRRPLVNTEAAGNRSAHAAPKVEDLLALHQPSVVIVQMGTNWMDAVQAQNFATERPKYELIIQRFAYALFKTTRSVRKVIWITPPDSSRYSPQTEIKVEKVIEETARRYGIDVINSSDFTHYTPGQSGGDGVHYRASEVRDWAAGVQSRMLKRGLISPAASAPRKANGL